MRFVDGAPTPYHAVDSVGRLLDEKGFEVLEEGRAWTLKPGGRYRVSRNGSAVAAVVVGTNSPHESGMRIIGAHTDSPALKIKPNASGARKGHVTLGVEVYGGPVLATWIDRDLRIAGRVALAPEGGDPEPRIRLVELDAPRVTVPGLAIHLNRKVNDEGLKVDAQENLPVLLAPATDGDASSALTELLARHLSVDPGEVLAHDLLLTDAQSAAFAGLDDVFLRSGRLDDLAMCHAAIEALARSLEQDRPHTRIVILYDNEEVGSATAQGAVSPLLSDVIERIVLAHGGGREEFLRTRARSFIVSADMAHALNPNHAAKHDDRHRPVLGGGPVLKMNASMRYATDARGWSLFERACAAVDVPVQRYVNRSDLPCGSTIGPLASSRTGIPTVDVGNPILAMHSIRETVGTRDHELMIRALTSLLEGAG
jgi:aspartyl aminopeptidase